MKLNEGTADRVIRIIVGLVMLYPFFFHEEGWLSWVSVIGAIPLVTGIGGYCPLYRLVGISTIGFGKSDETHPGGHAHA